MSGNDVKLLEQLRWAIAFVPVILVVTTAQIRSMIKRLDLFSWENLYLGVELCIAALAIELVEIADLLRRHADNPQSEAVFGSRMLWGFGLGFATATVLLAVAGMHQKWDVEAPRSRSTSAAKARSEQRVLNEEHRNKQIFWLGFASNFVGILPLLGFVWLRATNRF